MKRNSVYIAFVLGGALLGERVVEYGFNTMWERNNEGVSQTPQSCTDLAEVLGFGGGGRCFACGSVGPVKSVKSHE